MIPSQLLVSKLIYVISNLLFGMYASNKKLGDIENSKMWFAYRRQYTARY